MRFRARHPDGRQAVIVLDDTATISNLRMKIQSSLHLSAFDLSQSELKYGFPPKSLKLDDFPDSTSISAAEINLNNESVQVIPPSQPPPAQQPNTKNAQTSRISQPAPSSSNPTTRPSPKKPSNPGQEPPEISLPSESATLVLRVMPDDNSCLFRAISTAVSGDQDVDHVTKLRWHCAQYIQANPSIYSKAILGKEPAAYCAWIQQESSWGGDIELDILSRVLHVEIDACIVSPFQVQRYNEGAEERIVLVYSGIHYDTVAVSPDPEGDMGAEFDVRRWETRRGSGSEYVLEGVRKLCRKLEERGYMTNTSSFGIRCNTCGWKGNGEREATKHAVETGHMDMEEVK